MKIFKISLFLIVGILIMSVAFSFVLRKTDFERDLRKVVAEYEFSLPRWQLVLLREFFNNDIDFLLSEEEQVEVVLNYFNGQEEDTRLVERIISKQIEEVLAEEGFILLPKVNFKIVSLPSYLVISPREEIRRKKELHIVAGLDDTKKGEIESAVDALGVSSIITEIAGTPTFPIVVSNNSSLRQTIELVTHEWVHQHLFFRPVGFRYAMHFLGFKNDAIATVNEAAAVIMEKEIGDIVYNRHYLIPPLNGHAEIPAASDALRFNFADTMRRIRQEIESPLLLGNIEEAEKYMEEQRQYINSYGYNIRKLNQAYFAFHGTYPSISVNPLTQKVHEIRQNNDSLKDFLNDIGSIWRAEDLFEID
jgi:hypothetical protein